MYMYIKISHKKSDLNIWSVRIQEARICAEVYNP